MIISFIMHDQPPPPAAPENSIMPDRSLTYSRAGAPPGPPNPPGFIDLQKSSHCCGASTPATWNAPPGGGQACRARGEATIETEHLSFSDHGDRLLTN